MIDETGIVYPIYFICFIHDYMMLTFIQPDMDTATREHVIEVSLPKISSIGHVEVRFSLRATANDIPEVKVALLYYKTDGRVGDV